jgi:hypothetical protein
LQGLPYDLAASLRWRGCSGRRSSLQKRPQRGFGNTDHPSLPNVLALLHQSVRRGARDLQQLRDLACIDVSIDWPLSHFRER